VSCSFSAPWGLWRWIISHHIWHATVFTWLLFGVFLDWVIFSHKCTDQYSVEELRTLSSSKSSLCAETFPSIFCPLNFGLLGLKFKMLSPQFMELTDLCLTFPALHHSLVTLQEVRSRYCRKHLIWLYFFGNSWPDVLAVQYLKSYYCIQIFYIFYFLRWQSNSASVTSSLSLVEATISLKTYFQ
jgi:hypothetical protein